MANYSTAVNNARLDVVESTIGSSPTLTLYSGAKPTACSDADPAGALVAIVLPGDWMNAASSASKSKNNSWTGTASGGAATAPQSFRIHQGATCHMQGTAGVASGECQVDTAITAGQTVTVSSFVINAGNT